MNCNRCGRFMALIAEWDEYPFGPYIIQSWVCSCGNTRMTCDDFRLRKKISGGNDMKVKVYTNTYKIDFPKGRSYEVDLCGRLHVKDCNGTLLGRFDSWNHVLMVSE